MITGFHGSKDTKESTQELTSMGVFRSTLILKASTARNICECNSGTTVLVTNNFLT